MASIINASTSSGLITSADTSGVLQLQNNGTVAVTVTGGNVGIGTSSPAGPLNVSGTGQLFTMNGGGTSGLYQIIANTGGTFILGNQNSIGNGPVLSVTGAYDSLIGTQTSTNLLFLTNNTEKMRLDTSGNLLVGSTSAGSSRVYVRNTGNSGSYTVTQRSALTLEDDSVLTNGPTTLSIAGNQSGATPTNNARISFLGQGYTGVTTEAARLDLVSSQGSSSTNINGNLVFSTSSNSTTPSERMRIDSSGKFYVNTTTASNSSQVNFTSGGNICSYVVTAGSCDALSFYTSTSTLAGRININGTTTSYLSVSDYRLKENIQPMVGALDKVKQLRPVTYDWISDKKQGQGFIAHELQAIVPDCVVGEKDAVDAEGKPDYQSIDTSFLVATLTSAIQELSAQVQALNAKVGITS